MTIANKYKGTCVVCKKDVAEAQGTTSHNYRTGKWDVVHPNPCAQLTPPHPPAGGQVPTGDVDKCPACGVDFNLHNVTQLGDPTGYQRWHCAKCAHIWMVKRDDKPGIRKAAKKKGADPVSNVTPVVGHSDEPPTEAEIKTVFPDNVAVTGIEVQLNAIPGWEKLPTLATSLGWGAVQFSAVTKASGFVRVCTVSSIRPDHTIGLWTCEIAEDEIGSPESYEELGRLIKTARLEMMTWVDPAYEEGVASVH